MSGLSGIAIIGAGPAGLMAAETLSGSGYAVTIYDGMPSPARKFLIAGRGGLNLTHSEPLEQFMTRYGEARHFLAPHVEAFPPDALRAWCEGLGEATFIGSSGRIFPKSMKAVSLLRAWLKRLEGQGVQYRPRHRWLGWSNNALLFHTPLGTIEVTADATLLALGGASWPRLGSDGAWVQILRSHGVAVSTLLPANSGFRVPWSPYFSQKFAGQAIKPLAVHFGDIAQQGEAMVTQNGIEGGVIYALSSHLRKAIEAGGEAKIRLNLRPDMPQDALAQKLRTPRGNQSLSTYLRKMGFAPIDIALLRETTHTEQLKAMGPEALAARLQSLPLKLSGVADLARAISSAGGIALKELDENLMLKKMPGVFAAGEMLDWEAPTGGYLLQACFSTAVASAKGIQNYIRSGGP